LGLKEAEQYADYILGLELKNTEITPFREFTFSYLPVSQLG
jgi:hypothetical protein